MSVGLCSRRRQTLWSGASGRIADSFRGVNGKRRRMAIIDIYRERPYSWPTYRRPVVHHRHSRFAELTLSALSSEYTFLRRNYVLGIVNGAAFIASMQLFDPNTVGALFVMHLTDKKAVVGLVYSLMLVGWAWPQILMSNVLEHRPFKMPFYVLSAVTRVVVFGLILLAIALVGNRSSTLLLWAYGLLMFSLSSLGGIGIIPFMDVVSKSMPPNRRGSFFSLRRLYGGVFGIAGGLFVKYILSEELSLAFPTNFLIIFGVAFALTVVSTGSFCFASEPQGPVAARTMSLGQRVRRGWRIFRRDRNYQSLYLVRAATALGSMSLPLYAIYAVKHLAAPEHRVGVFILIGSFSATFATLLWRHLGDVYGNRVLLMAGAVLGVVAPFVALMTALMPPARLGGCDLRLTLYLLVFATAAPALSANGIAYTNYLLEIAPETRRPTYVGFMYTIGTPLAFAALVGGYLADTTSFEFVFVLSQVFAVAAVWLAWRMDEPRQSPQLASRYTRWGSSLRADGMWTAPSSARPPRRP